MATAIRRVYQTYQITRTGIRDVNRFRQIVTVLVRYGLGFVVQRMGLKEAWLPGVLRGEKVRDVEGVPLPKRVLYALQELGPTFVKLGQILSTRPDLVPPDFVAELKTLQDNVGAFPFEQVRTQIESTLGKKIEEVFSEFNETPMASASIAQVHRARLHGGEEVVVKVQRPGIRPQIECDIEILEFLARQLEANFPETRLFSPLGIVAEFEKAILKEIDFRVEREHIERFRRNFADVRGVHFPIPYKDYSSREVLVMEFIRGVKITDVLDDPKYDKEKIVKAGIDVVFKMVYVDGFIHADMHPGNLLVRENSELCLIDCGLVGILTPKQKDNLCSLLIHLVRQDYRGVCRVLWEIAVHDKPLEYFDTFEADVVQLMTKWFGGKSLSDLEFGGFFKDLIDGALRHQMIMPPDYTMTFKSLVTMEGIAKQLCPEINIIEEAQPYVMRLLAERYSPRRILSDFMDGARVFAQAVRFLPQRLNTALIDLREGRIALQIELDQTRTALRAYQKAQNRNQLAVVEAALLLCGTMTLDRTDFQLFGLPGFPVVFYGLAIVLGLGHFLGIFRSGGA